jgi:DUF1680 family protein
MTGLRSLLVFVSVFSCGLCCGATAAGEAGDVVKLQPFTMSQVRLLDGRLKRAQETNLRYLLSLEPDRLLHTFRVNAGLDAPGEPLGGWEGPKIEVRGHFIGHYLSACALMYASTGDERLLQRGNLMVAEIAKCQQALGGEYLSAFPESFWDRLESGKSPWAPYYTIHKIMAGLYDQHTLCGNAQALEMMKGMAAYMAKRTEKYSHEEWNKILDKTEEGGICEALWNLYGVTGEPAHRALADKFEKSSFLDPLALGVDNLSGRHGNTHIPLVVGAIRRYELLKDPRYEYLSEFFWDRVINARSFATGGSTNAEMWGEPFKLANTLSRSNHETCKTYNMLRLTRHLLCTTADSGFGDYYERAHLNGILGTQEPESGMLEYYVPQESGFQRVFGSACDAFWCCTGTGVESYAKLADSVYFHDADGVYVNLFIPSRVVWAEKGITVEQRTAFPEEAGTTLALGLASPADFGLSLRIPAWAGPASRVTVNGEPVQAPAAPGTWMKIQRLWKDGDQVRLELPMRLHAVPMPDDPNLEAFMYGPVVLAGVLDDQPKRPPVIANEPITPMADAEKARKAWYFLAETADDLSWLKPVDGQPLTFTSSNQPFTITFKPFNTIVGERYGLYWPVVPKDSDRHKSMVKQNRALDFLRDADAAMKDGPIDDLRKTYDELAADRELTAYSGRLIMAMAGAMQRAGRDADARALVAPLAEPFASREDAAAVMAILGNAEKDLTNVKPWMIPMEAGDGAAIRTEKGGRACISSDASHLKPHIYFAVPTGSVLRGLGQEMKMTIDYHTDGKAGRKLLVEYDALDSVGGPYTGAQAVECPAEEGWQQAVVSLPGAMFTGRENAGADFRVSGAGSGDVCVANLRIAADPILFKDIMAAFDEGGSAPIDAVEPADAPSEKAHSMNFGSSAAGTHMGRGWRHAEDWLSYDLAVDPQKPTTLTCVYWGSDVGRRFDIEVDGKVIATQELQMSKPAVFFRVDYPIPAELSKGKDKVTVTFRKVSGLVGGVFGCSTRLTSP